MFSRKFVRPGLVSTLAVASCLIGGMPLLSYAQSNPGFTIFSGIPRENQLGYHLDFGGQPNAFDRYKLRIPATKMEIGVAQIAISYPDYYDGKFDTGGIEVRVDGKSLPLSEVNWDKENQLVQIYLDEAIEAGNGVEIVFSNVKNPRFGGTYYFNCQILSPGDIPLPRYLGTWILSIGRSGS